MMVTFSDCFIFVCTLYCGLLIQDSVVAGARFTKYLRYEHLDGLVCKSEYIMLNASAPTWVECSLLCIHTNLCFGIFHNPGDKTCTGCTYFAETETLTQTGTKFYGRTGYQISDERLTWSEAKDNCVAEGGHLAIVNSLLEQQLLDRLFKPPGNDVAIRIWIGANDMVKEGSFTWVDGTAVSNTTFSNWGPGQPNNYNSQNCVDLYIENGKWLWNDERCGEKHMSLCEIN